MEKARGQSRYIGQLLVKAQEREREADVVFERRTVKERQKEDHLYGDKEKFVTAAYKKKLEADAAFAAQEKAADAAEAAADVSKRRDMSAFYANLLTKNTAFGCAHLKGSVCRLRAAADTAFGSLIAQGRGWGEACCAVRCRCGTARWRAARCAAAAARRAAQPGAVGLARGAAAARAARATALAAARAAGPRGAARGGAGRAARSGGGAVSGRCCGCCGCEARPSKR